MKKFAICCLALFVVAMLVPSAQAATSTKCYHLTNFCDQIQVNVITQLGGIQKTEIVGLWDWVCLGSGGTLISGSTNKIGTQPTYPYVGGAGYGFNANFSFQPSSGLFDLYGTFDGVSAFAFQTAQPFTRTNGACPLAPTKGQPSISR